MKHSPDTVLDRVLAAIQVVSRPKAVPKPPDELFADLGLDSVDVVEVQLILEEHYGFENIWDEFWESRHKSWVETMRFSATVQELADFVERKLTG